MLRRVWRSGKGFCNNERITEVQRRYSAPAFRPSKAGPVKRPLVLLEFCTESGGFELIVISPEQELRPANGETLSARCAPKRWRDEPIEVDPVVNDPPVRLEQKTRALLVAAVPEIHIQGGLRTRELSQ